MQATSSNLSIQIETSNQIHLIDSYKDMKEDIDVVGGIKAINASVNWSHYDLGIIKDLNKNIYALYQNNVIGYLTYSKNSKCTYIPFIAVHTDHQGKKVGDLLMTRIFEKSKSEGIEDIILDFRGNNEKLVKFYTGIAEKMKVKKLTLEPSGYYQNKDPRTHAIYTL